MFKTANDVTLGATISGHGFELIVNGTSPVRCEYVATYGFEGFGRNRRKVRYPLGAIKVIWTPRRYRVVKGLDAAKEAVAKFYNSECA